MSSDLKVFPVAWPLLMRLTQGSGVHLPGLKFKSLAVLRNLINACILQILVLSRLLK